MTRNRSMTFLAGAAVIPVTALAAGCGGGNSGATASTHPNDDAPEDDHRAGGDPPCREQPPRKDPRRLAWPHALPVQEGRGGEEERVLRHVRHLLAAAAGERQADRRQRDERLPALNHQAVRRKASGQLQRPPALHLRDGQEGGRHEGRGPDRVRRQLVRDIAIGEAGLPEGIDVSRQLVLVAPRGTGRSKAGAATGRSKAGSRPAAPPPPKPAPQTNGGIPQNNGGDGDSDNNGGPSDGDGNV